MKTTITLEAEPGMKERDVRDAIDQAAKKAFTLEQQQGKGVQSFEKVRDKMREFAEKDKRQGRI